MPEITSVDGGVLIIERVNNSQVDNVQLAGQDAEGNRLVLHFTASEFQEWIKTVARTIR